MDRAAEIAAVRAHAREVLDAKHAAREVTLGACRQIIQSCAAAIRAVQREEFARRRGADRGGRRPTSHAPTRRSSGTPTCATVGTCTTPRRSSRRRTSRSRSSAAIRSRRAATIGVEIPAYLNGMAEAASELRRHTLDCLRADRLARAEELLAVMDEVYALLVTVDYPDAVTGGLRRTTDALRAVIERTRGDLTNALVAQRLRVAIEEQRTVRLTAGDVASTRESPGASAALQSRPSGQLGRRGRMFKRIAAVVVVALVGAGCHYLDPGPGLGPNLAVQVVPPGAGGAIPVAVSTPDLAGGHRRRRRGPPQRPGRAGDRHVHVAAVPVRLRHERQRARRQAALRRRRGRRPAPSRTRGRHQPDPAQPGAGARDAQQLPQVPAAAARRRPGAAVLRGPARRAAPVAGRAPVRARRQREQGTRGHVLGGAHRGHRREHDVQGVPRLSEHDQDVVERAPGAHADRHPARAEERGRAEHDRCRTATGRPPTSTRSTPGSVRCSPRTACSRRTTCATDAATLPEAIARTAGRRSTRCAGR